MMIGVSMAIAIAICIAAFIWLYVQIGPLFSDFVSQQPATSDEPGNTVGVMGDEVEPTPSPPGLVFDDLGQHDEEFEPAPAATSEPAPGVVEEDEGETQNNDGTEGPGDADTQDESVIDDNDDAASADDQDDEIWEPTHQIREGPNVNFRSGPNTISQSQGTLSPGTPLRFLGEEEPAGGVTWMFFDIEDGTEGWIRDIDVIEFETTDDLDDDG